MYPFIYPCIHLLARVSIRSEMRRWSLVSQSSGYTTGATDSPASLSVSLLQSDWSMLLPPSFKVLPISR